MCLEAFLHKHIYAYVLYDARNLFIVCSVVNAHISQMLNGYCVNYTVHRRVRLPPIAISGLV